MAFKLAEAFVQLSSRGLGGVLGGISRITGSLLAMANPASLAASAIAALGAGAGIGGMLKLAADLEKVSISLETLLGSAQAGRKGMADLGSVEAAGMMEYVAAEATQTAEALQRMQNQGRITTGEMDRMARRGIPAWDLLAKKLGKNGAELRNLAAQGRLASDRVLPALTEALQEGGHQTEPRQPGDQAGELDPRAAATAAARRRLQELRQFAAETPFEFPELVDAHRRLMAFGFSAQEVIPVLRTLGDTTAAFGGGSDMIQGVSLALGQMQAKGKVAAQEMNQLAERGVPAWEMLSEALGKSKSELMKLGENGQLMADVAVPALLNALQNRYGGAMARMSQTASGLWSTLKDNVGFLFADIGAMAIEAFRLKDVLRSITDFVAGFRDRFGGPIMAVFETIRSIFVRLWEATAPIREAFADVGSMIASMMGKTGEQMESIRNGLVTFFGGIAAVVGAIIRRVGLVLVKLEQFARELLGNGILEGIGKAIGGFLQWVAAIIDAMTASRTFNAILNAVVAAGKLIGTIFGGVFRVIGGVFAILSDLGVFRGLELVFAAIAWVLDHIVGTLIEGFISGVRVVIGVVEMILWIFEGIVATIRTIIDLLTLGPMRRWLAGQKESPEDQDAAQASEDQAEPHVFKGKEGEAPTSSRGRGNYEFLNFAQLAEKMQQEASRNNDMARQIHAAESTASGVAKLGQAADGQALRVRMVDQSNQLVRLQPNGM